MRLLLAFYAFCNLAANETLVTAKLKKIAKLCGMTTKKVLGLIPGLIEKGWVESVANGYELHVPAEARAQHEAYEATVESETQALGHEPSMLRKLCLTLGVSEEEARQTLRDLAAKGLIELEETPGKEPTVFLDGEVL